MELSTWSPTGKRPKPPPLWLVTNGDVTVGPINTTLLVRGVVDGRIWDGFYVRDTRTQAWRPVHEVREVRSVNERLYRRHLPLAPRDANSLEALMMLTEDPREVLSLFYLDGLSLAEVSQVLAIPVGTVKSRLHRARHLLRQHVTGDFHD